MKPRPFLAALMGAGAMLAFSASPASAALTTSNITAPADGTVVYSQNPGTVTVSGTSNGTTGDHVQAICFYGDQVGVVSDATTGPVSIPVAADGSFSMNVDKADFFGQGLINPCVLRAIPEPVTAPPPANPPGSPSSFTGPTITVQGQNETRFSSGPNNGTLYDFYLQDVQSKGAFDYVSAGSCGLYDSYLWDPVTFAVPTSLFYCNDGMFATDGNTGPPDTGRLPATGSELRVDGVNAYLAGAMGNFDPFGNGFDPSTKSGYLGISWTPTYDPVTQGVTITESDRAMKCSPSPGTYPPTNTSCDSFVPAGVKLDRTIVQDHDGQLATIKTRWSSTDGAQHQLSVELENEEHGGDPTHDVALQLPWISPDFIVPTVGDLAGPPTGPGRINTRGHLSAPDGDKNTERGAIVFAGPPKSERVNQDQSTGSSYDAMTLNYDRTVPATGSTQFAFAYAHGFSQADVNGLADAAQAAFTPTVSMNPPAHSTFAKHVTVSGSSGFADGVAGVTVNGTPATVAPNGSWTASVPLKGGHNSLSAVVTTVYGGTATTAATDVVYAKLGLLGKPKAKGKFVVFRIHCDADAGSSCPGNALLAVKEKLRGHSVVGVTAKKRGKVRTKRISAGHKKFKVRGQKTATIKVPLNRRSLKLLKKFHKLPVRLTVDVAAAGVKDHVGGSKVVFRLKKKPRKA